MLAFILILFLFAFGAGFVFGSAWGSLGKTRAADEAFREGARHGLLRTVEVFEEHAPGLDISAALRRRSS